MMRALITAGTGMVAQQTNLDVISNNLSNINTVAFKGMRAEFQDLMYQSLKPSGAETSGTVRLPGGIQVGLGTRYAGNSVNFSQGGLQATGNPYELAITGEGFFAVELPDGSTGYTRDGSFKRDADGTLVTSDGYKLIPNMSVPANATSFSVSANGNVSVQLPGQDQPQLLGTITLTTFPNPAGLTRLGQNIYQAGGASGDPQTGNPGENGAGSIQGGFVEGSNVSIVEEMIRMITAQRAYEINSKAIQTADDMLSILNQLKR
ncbi:MAG: flagellar basal-body rod protein FlgG [Armatimonadetes bacterium]|nr:flagellar basal-body rod protein FlgG [Armatimonadota bacterium]